MRRAIIPMIPNAPRYISPKERAENRARWLRVAYWLAVAVPATVALMMFGYSDQAPHWLREVTVGLDATFGFPVLWLIKAIAAP
jgi:hypothetical protein